MGRGADQDKENNDIAEKGYAAHWKYKHGMSQAHESGLEMWIEKVAMFLNRMIPMPSNLLMTLGQTSSMKKYLFLHQKVS